MNICFRHLSVKFGIAAASVTEEDNCGVVLIEDF